MKLVVAKLSSYITTQIEEVKLLCTQFDSRDGEC
jgi:hypothetical protein